MDKIEKLTESVSEIKSAIEYEARFSKEHRDWMVSRINEISDDLKHVNGRVRKTEVSIGWLRAITGVVGATIGWLVKKEL